MTFRRPDGKDAPGYGAGDKGAGVVVLQEWWGLNDQIKGVADRLAAAGYRTLVPDLYRGKVTLDAKEAGHLMSGLDFADAASQDVRGAVLHLKQAGGRVAVIGFCMGGALSVLSGVLAPEVDAIVSFYGYPPDSAGDVRKIRVPVLGHWALDDGYFTPAGVDALEKKLARPEFHRYAARHAFCNETGPNHDPAAAKLAWERTMEFLQRTVASSQ